MMKFGLKALLTGAALAAAAPCAWAQDNSAAQAPAQPTIGAPQLRDFSLQPQRRIVTQPPPAQTPPPTIAAPPPTAAAPQPTRAAPRAAPAAAVAAPPRQPGQAPQARPPASATLPPATGPANVQTQPVPAAPAARQAPAPATAAAPFPWAYALGGLVLALIAIGLVRRRRRAGRIVEAVRSAASEPEVEARAAIGARPEPAPRPWLEIALKAERLASTDAESLVQFELELVNNGAEAARNLRIDVKMFNAGEQQDQEIGAFFRTAGRETTKCNLPGIHAGQTGAIRGEVAMARADMKAVVLDNRYLFIPVLAVNVLYDWGDGRTGQTSKSYVVGRELEQAGEKMGAFRVDQGPRVWRTVGQRQHKLARRV